MPNKNKEQNKVYKRSYYLANKAKCDQYVINRRKGNRQWLNDYKADKHCYFCQENYIKCLDFHHLDETTKTDRVSAGVWQNGWSLKKIKEEISKCIIVCSNCHRKLHDGVLNVPHRGVEPRFSD